MIYWEREMLWKKPPFNNLIINVLKEVQQVDRGHPVNIIHLKAFGKDSYERINQKNQVSRELERISFYKLKGRS